MIRIRIGNTSYGSALVASGFGPRMPIECGSGSKRIRIQVSLPQSFGDIKQDHVDIFSSFYNKWGDYVSGCFKKHGENRKCCVKIKDPHFEYGSITLMFSVLFIPAEIKWPAIKP
jgi:hypothetical protein